MDSLNSNKSSGFTLVEVAIVVVIVGILSALTIVGFGAWRSNLAKDEVQSDLKQAALAMESDRNFGNQYAIGGLPAAFSSSPNVEVDYADGGAASYCIDGTPLYDSSIQYHISTGVDTPESGLCSESYEDDVSDPGDDGGVDSPDGPYEDVVGDDDATGYCSFDTSVSADNNHKASYSCDDLDTGSPTLAGILDNNRCGIETWAMNEPGAYDGSYSLKLIAPTGEKYSHYSTSGQQNFANNVTNWTVETWVKFDTSAVSKSIISVEKQWGLRSTSNGFACDHLSNAGGDHIETVESDIVTPQAGQWYLLTCSYNGGEMKLFVNGNEASSRTFAHGFNNTTGAIVHLGSYNNNWAEVGNDQLTGWIDDFAFYRGASLTESDAQERFSYAQ